MITLILYLHIRKRLKVVLERISDVEHVTVAVKKKEAKRTNKVRRIQPNRNVKS